MRGTFSIPHIPENINDEDNNYYNNNYNNNIALGRCCSCLDQDDTMCSRSNLFGRKLSFTLSLSFTSFLFSVSRRVSPILP